MHHRTRHGAALAAGLALLGGAVAPGCSSDDDGATPTTGAPVELAGASLCDDPSGDADGPVDLRSVGLVVRGDDLAVTWAVARAAGTGAVTATVRLDGAEITVDDPGGEAAASGGLVVGGDRRIALDDVEATRDRIQARVPLAGLDGIAGDWTATVAVDGATSDTCGPTPLPGA